MEIQQFQNDVHTWITTTGVRYFNPMTNLGILMEEVGELSRIMVRQYGEQSSKESDTNKNLADEMADIMWVMAALANQCDVNLTDAIKKNFDKKNNRDANRHLQNPKLQD
jgi:NTP pyrophosphatase (non-canonical NTP hydrolase)